MRFNPTHESSSRLSLVWRALFVMLICSSTSLAVLIPLESPFGTTGPTNPELVNVLEILKKGEIDEAQALTEDFIQDNPDSAPGHEILGVILVIQGETESGLAELKEAVRLNPGQATAYTKIGDVLMAKGDDARAKANFLQAVALNPSDRLAHQRLGLLYEKDQETALAIEHFEKGLVGAPSDYLGIKVNLGGLYNQARRYERTIQLLTPVVTENTTHPAAHLVLGTAYLGLNQVTLALESLERAKDLADDPNQTALAFGVAYRNAGQLEKSEVELRNALQAQPKSSGVQFQLAETLVAMGRADEALELFSRAASDPGAHVLATNRMGEVYAASGQIEKAIATYQPLRESREGNLATYIGLSKAYQAAGNMQEAENVLWEVVGIYPDNAEARYRLGMQLAASLQYVRAESVLKRARELSPADPRIQKAISLVTLRQGKLADAIAEGERLLELVPDSTPDQFYLATLLEQAGRDEEAREIYKGILATNPDEVASLNNLAQLHLKSGDPESALELSTRALELAGDNPIILDTHGWILYQSGDSKDALQHLERAIASGRASPTHRYHLSVVYNDLGKKDEARAQLGIILNADSDFPEVEAARALARDLN